MPSWLGHTRVNTVMKQWFHNFQGILASRGNISFSGGVCSQQLHIFVSVRNLQHRVVLRWMNLVLTATLARWQRYAFVTNSFWGNVCVYSQDHRLLTAENQGEGKHRYSSILLQHGLWTISLLNAN
jgi:hypothetical protein